MFVEPNLGSTNRQSIRRSGWIEVISGAMFSGKTEELIRRLNRAIIARQKVEIFKPAIDKRYHEQYVISHDKNQIRSNTVDFANEILFLSSNQDVVGIDEAQFFDDELVEVVNKLADLGKRVIVAGLDMDFKRKPFGPMPVLMAIAEFVTKVHPVCIRCGQIASYSHRLTKEGDQVLIGEKDFYEPLCRDCYTGLNQ